MTLPADYPERVYAGVLGKIIGVYLGRPFEGWQYERILKELGEVYYYVHDRLNVPLVVTDDDIAGTFTFIRALEDYAAAGRDLQPAQIGETWLNYLVEKQSVLWWGGLGMSTEHTAYLRLKHGIPAPQSGSMAVNGKVVAEQIGAQIFIDGWAMVAPGNPELAAELARKAGSVSHDGEALYGAQVLAAMEAMAFVESDIDKLLDTGLSFIPKDSVIYRLVQDLRNWHAAIPDWHAARQRIVENYGYDKYGHNCHIVPNHALIHLGLLYGGGDFQKSLMICNTCGWDTDCNSGNLGCLLGIRNGLKGLDCGPDWRGPVADRLFIPTADGGRAVSDAVKETYHLVNMGRRLAGEPPIAPKQGAIFHFDLPGSVQGFMAEQSPETAGTLHIGNAPGHSIEGQSSLVLRYRHLAPGRAARASSATFLTPEVMARMLGYPLNASPRLYPGQVVRARLAADETNAMPVQVRLFLRCYDKNDQAARMDGPSTTLAAGQDHVFEWRIPSTGGYPIFEIGVEITANTYAEGCLFLDYLTWDGAPDASLGRPEAGGTTWGKAWVWSNCEMNPWSRPIYLIQNEGQGMILQGTREWKDYRLEARLEPFMLNGAGIAVRAQGLRRYYALFFRPGGVLQLVKRLEKESVLAQVPFDWKLEQDYSVTLQVQGSRLQAWVDGSLLLDTTDQEMSLDSGAIAILVEEGLLKVKDVRIQPV
mgnify:CR=1 FL=1